MGKRLRILYAAGPGNVLGTYRHWKQGKDDPSQVAITYSGQFYDVCRELDAEAYVIASCNTPGSFYDDRFHIEHRFVPFEDSSGVLYHLGQIWYGLRLFGSALRWRANVAVICGGTHWFLLWLLTLCGIDVVPSLHALLWRKYTDRSSYVQMALRGLNGLFFGRGCVAIISVSEEITRQVKNLMWAQNARVMQFTPIYRPHAFANMPEPPAQRKPFRILFVGRIEKNKGIFELLSIAERFIVERRTEFEFDICGAGGALGDLRRAVQRAGLSASFRCHGHCNQDQMRLMYGNAHAVVVPTTSDFVEGFNKVVVEGVLAGRPVVTSSVCPAVASVREAVIEIAPDDVKGYGDAIRELCDNRELYERKCRACGKVRAQFYDVRRSWAQTLKDILKELTPPTKTNRPSPSSPPLDEGGSHRNVEAFAISSAPKAAAVMQSCKERF